MSAYPPEAIPDRPDFRDALPLARRVPARTERELGRRVDQARERYTALSLDVPGAGA